MFCRQELSLRCKAWIKWVSEIRQATLTIGEILHHSWRFSSKTAIQYHCKIQVLGMSLCTLSCIGFKELHLYNCNSQSHGANKTETKQTKKEKRDKKIKHVIIDLHWCHSLWLLSFQFTCTFVFEKYVVDQHHNHKHSLIHRWQLAMLDHLWMINDLVDLSTSHLIISIYN